MYRKLCDEYNSYFNVGTALCSFFLMNENDVWTLYRKYKFLFTTNKK